MINALMIHPSDNVAVVTEPVAAGDNIQYIANGQSVMTVTAKETIPVYHKVAVKEIPEGTVVIKYAHPIGQATTHIQKGEYVHCHNVESPHTKEQNV